MQARGRGLRSLQLHLLEAICRLRGLRLAIGRGIAFVWHSVARQRFCR